MEILPKVDPASDTSECRGILLRLLRSAGEFPAFRHLSVGQNLRKSPLLEIFIVAFFESIREIVSGGLMRRYELREEDVQCVRGRIIAERQFASLSNRVDRIACRYDDLTADNLWNRVLKRALEAVRKWILGFEVLRQWSELLSVFDEVGELDLRTWSTKRLVFDRQALRYRTAIDWACWILALLTPGMRGGDSNSPELLFNMNDLFENAMAAVLRRRAAHSVAVITQECHYLARLRDVDLRACRLEPDLILQSEGGRIAIGDTKWKRLQVTRSGYLAVAPEDVYQMHAYGAALGCEHLALIYPWHSGLSGSKETILELPPTATTRPALTVVCVDVSDDGFIVRRGAGAPGFGELITAT
jgi:5-methylcytosine-specific restriction enzyme subunit McrC